MASNILPHNPGQLIGLGNQMLAGLSELGTIIGITQITPAEFSAKLTAFANAQNIFSTARTSRQSVFTTHRIADRALQEWLVRARSVLAGRLGQRWSPIWVEAGFVGHSAAIPATIADRIQLAASLKNYFTANPGYEVESMEVTAAKAGALHDAAVAVQATLNTAIAETRAKRNTRSTVEEELRTVMRGLISTLLMLLGKSDPRWDQFGLTMPSADTTPGQPQNLTVVSLPGQPIIASCDPVPLATRYRWRIKVAGVDKQFRLAASTPLPQAMIAKIKPGQLVEFIVQAVNGSAQGVASETVEVQTVGRSAAKAQPAPAPAAPEAVVEKEEPAPLATAPVEPERNGSLLTGNGQHSLARG